MRPALNFARVECTDVEGANLESLNAKTLGLLSVIVRGLVHYQVVEEAVCLMTSCRRSDLLVMFCKNSY